MDPGEVPETSATWNSSWVVSEGQNQYMQVRQYLTLQSKQPSAALRFRRVVHVRTSRAHTSSAARDCSLKVVRREVRDSMLSRGAGEVGLLPILSEPRRPSVRVLPQGPLNSTWIFLTLRTPHPPNPSPDSHGATPPEKRRA